MLAYAGTTGALAAGPGRQRQRDGNKSHRKHPNYRSHAPTCPFSQPKRLPVNQSCPPKSAHRAPRSPTTPALVDDPCQFCAPANPSWVLPRHRRLSRGCRSGPCHPHFALPPNRAVPLAHVRKSSDHLLLSSLRRGQNVLSESRRIVTGPSFTSSTDMVV